MINRKWLEEALDTALLGGGDFAEIFAENTKNNVISLVDSKIDRIEDRELLKAYMKKLNLLVKDTAEQIGKQKQEG